MRRWRGCGAVVCMVRRCCRSSAGTLGACWKVRLRWSRVGRAGWAARLPRCWQRVGLVASSRSGAAYCASKAGVVNLTRALAVEWASFGIQVNAVAPTYAPTALTEGLFQDQALLQSVLERTPNHKLATPESIAEAV